MIYNEFMIGSTFLGPISPNKILNQETITPSFERFFSIASSSRARSAQEVLRRLDSSNKELQAQAIQPEVDAGREIWLSAQDYTLENNLEMSIANFIEQTVKAKPNMLYCVDPTRIHQRESVFLTEDYAIKVFPRVENCFDKIAAEISGLDIIRKLDLQESRHVEFIAVGRCVINAEDNLLLLMRRAPGKTIKCYIDSIFTGSNRPSALNESKYVLAQLGRLLGELHAKKAVTHQGDDPLILQITFGKLKDQITKYLERYNAVGGEDLEVITRFFEKIFVKYDSKTFHFTISHSDAHLENFLFDSKFGMTLIDTPRIHHSVNGSGEPLFASYVHDIARVEDDIAKWVLYHEYNEALIAELQEAFRAGYKEKAFKLINNSQIFADKAWTMLTRLKSVVPYRYQDGPNSRIYQYYSEFFKKDYSEEF